MNEPVLWPLALYLAAVLALVVVMIGLSALLGERHRERATDEPYESGIVSTGSPRLRHGIGFMTVALLFLLFDLEAAFIFTWAVSARATGWAGYAGLVVFLVVLAVALVYEWRVGALEVAPPRGRRSRPR